MRQAKKSLGQHFLMHARIAARIADASGIGTNDTVLEIGPGTGILTRELLSRSGRVVAIETDGALVEELTHTFTDEITSGKLVLLHQDIRSFDTTFFSSPYALVANIPYYLTGEILRFFLSAQNQPSSMTLLVQKEVAQRIAREKKESLLSLSVKAYGTPRYLFTVTKGSFVPAPKVDSAVLHIADISRSRFVSSEEEQRFFTLIHAGFAHKRKKLGGNLASFLSPGQLEEADVDPHARAEDLVVTDWIRLCRLAPANAHI